MAAAVSVLQMLALLVLEDPICAAVLLDLLVEQLLRPMVKVSWRGHHQSQLLCGL